MPLSNAERQARHRERVRQRVFSATKPENSQDHREMLLNAVTENWQAGGQRLLEHGDAWIDAVVDEFMTLPPPSFQDVLDLVREAGHARAVRIMEQHAAAFAKEAMERPVYQPPASPAPSKPKRRRKPVT